MLEKIIQHRALAIFIHLVLGWIFAITSFSKLFVALLVCYGIYEIINLKNKNDIAFLMACYMVGAEVFIRMTGGALVYEIGKYGVVIFLITGIIFQGTSLKTSPSYIIYLLLLSLGIVLTSLPEGVSIRKAIIFNLSGPIVLGICALYFYKRIITLSTLLSGLYLMLLPLFSMMAFLYVRTPDLSEIVFGTEANFYTSGGFGPNQVSTVVGLGVFIMTIFLMLKVRMTQFRIVTIVFLLYFIYRGLLTFSRGGILGALIIIVCFTYFISKYKSLSLKTFFKYFIMVAFFGLGIWLYTAQLTNGMLVNRYIGKTATGKDKDITSGRGEILKMQLENFYENPIFGIGVGNGKYIREEQAGHKAASHNEISRLLEEHGAIGIIILIILFSESLTHIYHSNNLQRAFLVSFLLFWFLTIAHSAMRIALPAFFYGLSLINITDYEEA